MSEDRVKLEPSWKARVGSQFARPEMIALGEFLRTEKTAGKVIYPPGSCIFAALDSTPFEAVKVVILGQDPYHGPHQAHGLCFSVLPGVPAPPSLENVFKEIARDLGIARPDHGCLLPWARQGVLLLNSVLTVERGVAGSHQGKGWEGFTDACIDALNREREGIVFLLWGSYAQAKGKLIDTRRHRVLKAPHPSPLSAHRGFIGCGHFSRANEYLKERGHTAINWTLPPLAELG
ncbi:MAG: uracil-DNA glycosylase [Dokdonella sp.]